MTTIISNNGFKLRNLKVSDYTSMCETLDDFPEIINIINDLILNYQITNEKYIYDGCSLTLGKIINKYYKHISADNWMKTILKLNRKKQIFDVLNKVTDKMKELLTKED